MVEELERIGSRALKDVENCQTQDALESIRVSILGKNGELGRVLRTLGGLPPAERSRLGAHANQLKMAIEMALEQAKSRLEKQALELLMQTERVDVGTPARLVHAGSVHLISVMTEKIVNVFRRIGFEVTTGPEVETEYFNFESVNIPSGHPAREMQDTFYVGEGVVLRTHTTPVQMRTMKNRKWPLRILCPGAVYRRDNDATHSPMFHQIEGLWVDQGVRMSDLKGVLDYFAKAIFGEQVRIRLRPSYFPFVEPGAEVDVSCFLCDQKSNGRAGCGVCKGTGWVEILGAGMVHPHLFQEAGYEKDRVTGFAFGMGIERITMLYYRINDLRMLFQGDLRFLNQFQCT